MRLHIFGIVLLVGLWQTAPAGAGFNFTTDSAATQTITSPLFGNTPFTFTGVGTQEFAIDPVGGTASVISFFQGNDIPNPFAPGTYLSYNEYNTTTGGTVTQTSPGVYTITFHLLFEVDITSGPLAGLELDTTQSAIFQATNVADIPFDPGTVFGDPSRPNDPVAVSVKYDPTGTLPTGSQFGTSTDRTVTVFSVVPEPSSVVLLILGAFGPVAYLARRRRVTPKAATAPVPAQLSRGS
jgi:hypothetical protein